MSHACRVPKSSDMKGFVVLPVERTLSWFGRNRRLAKGFEQLWAPSLPLPPSSLLSGLLRA
jgi:hypothetical protein